MENYIISFGCMCSTAIFLREKGYRDRSYFFDWVDSNLVDNIKLVNDNFADILNRNFLQQKYKDNPHIITNIKYSLSFVHLFDPKKTFESQRKTIEQKINKNIRNFMDALKSQKAVLIYYLRKEDEVDIIKDNAQLVAAFLKKYNAKLIIISNHPCFFSFAEVFFIKANNIHKPFGGIVSFPFENTEEIENRLNSFVSEKERKTNIDFYLKRDKKNIFNRIQSFLKRQRKNRLKL